MHELDLSAIDHQDRGLLSGQYWGELRIFAEVARAKSFNRAADHLGLSQPTIARKVRRLQDVIGAHLFVSTKKGVRLTERGKELAAALLLFDRSVYSIASDLRARAREAEGLVGIAINEALATIFVVPAIPAFSARHPKLQLHLRNLAHLTDLSENQVDMMVTLQPVANADLTCEALGVLHLLPVATKGYVARHGLPTAETIHEHSVVQSRMYQTSAPVWRDWQDLCAKARIAHFSDTSFAYAMLVRQSQGIGLLGSYAVREPEIVPLDLGVHANLPIYAVAMTERLEARPVRLVFEWLCGLFGETNPLFRPEMALPDLADNLPQIGTPMR